MCPPFRLGYQGLREVLNYDEYMKEFSAKNSRKDGRPKRSIEASEETGVVLMDLPRLIQSFMDVSQWKEMFPCLISKAATVDVISDGEGPIKDGAVQLDKGKIFMAKYYCVILHATSENVLPRPIFRWLVQKLLHQNRLDNPTVGKVM